MSDVQDDLRMFGAKAERHVILFKRALLVAKKRDDVTMSVKVFIEVDFQRHFHIWKKIIHRIPFGQYDYRQHKPTSGWFKESVKGMSDERQSRPTFVGVVDWPAAAKQII